MAHGLESGRVDLVFFIDDAVTGEPLAKVEVAPFSK
jgi:hypothetical protein